jgi:hypothetical protein
MPRTAAQIAGNLRRTITQQVATINQRIQHNPSGIPAADILAAFGADAATVGQYLASGSQLVQVAPTVTPIATPVATETPAVPVSPAVPVAETPTQ